MNAPYSPNTIIESAKVSADLVGLSTGANDTSGNSLSTARSDAFFNFVVSGCVWTANAAGSTLLASMSSGVVVINGVRLTVAAVVSRTFAANVDTYVDLKDNGDGTATINYTTASNYAASPALFGSGTMTNTIRIAIITTGATNIASAASINQGSVTATLPVASSVNYSLQDSLGNLIYNRQAIPQLLGYRYYGGSQTSITTIQDVTGLTACPVIIPGGANGRNIRISWGLTIQNGTTAGISTVDIKESAGQLRTFQVAAPNNSNGFNFNGAAEFNATSGLHTYKLAITAQSGTASLDGSFSTLLMRVELLN